MTKKTTYPIGSISSATMRHEDLIPTFCDQLHWLAVHTDHGNVSRKRRAEHKALFTEIMNATEQPNYFENGDSSEDMERLFNALDEYAGPYFYFGAHPGDGADYGYWLSESWDEEFSVPTMVNGGAVWDFDVERIKVSDIADIPVWFRGEVAVVNDHGNVTLYVKSARKLTEVWGVV